MKKKNQSLGFWGENKAAAYLESSGYSILRRNVRYPFCEIDIIAEKNNTLYFIEVKTRTTDRFGEGFESVSPRKIQKIQKAAETYMQIEKLDKDVQIAILSILRAKENCSYDFLLV